MKELYYSKDKKRGVERTFIWFVEEVGELANALKNLGNENDMKAIGDEMADIFAWLCSLANILGIDLEAAALSKYPMACSKCGKNPCTCVERGING